VPYSAPVSFDVAAQAYDEYMGAWSAQLSPQLVELAGVEPGQRALDVGCGPGSLVAALLARLAPDAVAAVDPSASFLAAARDRFPGVELLEAGAEALPYPDGAFDVSLAQLVVHFMTDPVAGLREMARVTRDGGVVAVCVWDFAGGRGPLGPFWDAARALDPAVVDESALAGARQGHLAQLLEAAGLRDATEHDLPASRRFASFDAWWEPFTRGVGPGGAYAAGLPPGRRDALRERCRSMLPAGPFELTAHAWAARGVV
jgi:SAM-dependent methyltransferase